MREICPSCGKDMVVTTETFEVNGDAVRGIPHLLCRSCGEATFTPEQLDMVFGYRNRAEAAEAGRGSRRRSVRHFFMETDGMTVTYGDIVKGRLCDTVPYYVERDDGEGDFDFAQGSLPTCTPAKSKGFAESELWDIESFMRDNMHNIYDQIRGEGAWA